MKLALIHTSSNLETLNIDMAAPWVTSRSYICHDCLTRGSDFVNGIKKLRISKAGWGPGSIKCWKWIWKHVTNLESVQVQDASPEFVSCLERSISTHMHRLERIHLGRKTENIKEDKVHFYDSAIARLLEAGPRFNSIYLDMSARAKRATLRALPLHYSTLTEFTIEISTGTDSALIKILALCPNLRKLVTIQHGEYAFINKFMPHAGHQIFPEVDANVFADLHPRTKAYRPWACESTLETLQIKICGIPWSGDEGDSISCEEDQDSMPSEHDHGTAILQRQVYGRLARLTNLKTLWLGHDPMVADQYGLYGGCHGDVQKECLEMTLPSGLAVLGTLKKLKHLNVQALFHYRNKSGAEEVNWMFDNWPEMEKIWGINVFGPAHDWLEKYHPSLLGESNELWGEDLVLSDTYLSD
ncbi:hypothetical protein BG000_007747 [Podila horticola]|nr:hypothetical protein BG000_007747 [Podila horticola]